MSERDDSGNTDADDRTEGSVQNPFAPTTAEGEEQPVRNLSKRRAAAMGLTFGIVMVGLLVVCFLLTIALEACVSS